MISIASLPATGVITNHEENCATTGVKAVCPGNHTVDLRLTGVDNMRLSRASLWAMYVPFDGEGKSPSVLCNLP
jgi:hypothetical protein